MTLWEGGGVAGGGEGGGGWCHSLNRRQLCDLSVPVKASRSLTGGDSEISYDGRFVYRRSPVPVYCYEKGHWARSGIKLRRVCVYLCVCFLPLSVTLG